MGSIPGITSQVNSMGGCATPQDCCNEINGLKQQIGALSARIAALENKPYKDHSADIGKLFALLGTLQIGMASFGVELAGASALAAAASGVAAGAAAAIAAITAEIAAISASIAGFAAGLAALSAAILPLLGVAAVVAALGLTAAAAQTAADSAYSLADTALKIASSAGNQAATAIIRSDEAKGAAGLAQNVANAAQSAASTAQQLAQDAFSTAKGAFDKAISAIGIASGAETKATTAISTATAADKKAENAGIIASGADTKATTAIGTATAADKKAENAGIVATGANTKATTAISTATTADKKAENAGIIATGANTKATVAGTTAAAADKKATTAGATASAANEKATTAGATASAANEKATTAGITAATAASKANSADKKADEAIDLATKAGGKTPPGTLATQTDLLNQKTEILSKIPQILYPVNPTPLVNPGKEQEIIDLLKGQGTNILNIPAALVASQEFKSAAISAAAIGSCQSSKPVGCPGGSADQINGLKGIMDGLNGAIGLLNNAVLGSITNTLGVINSKLGRQITGGLSAWSTGIAEVVNKSQILNVLTYISVLHNAYMLSNALSQTLFSAVGNSLAALGLKDTSQDPAGTPFNVGKIVGDWTETFFKSVFGVATVNGIKSDWKKYNRVYQAAAQVVNSVQSIGHSILGALEVVGSHVAKIGNALQKFRVVSEKAYSWMNPTPSFQNRFFTGLQATQEVVSQIDQVSSEVISVQENITQMGKLEEELDKSLKEETGSKQATAIPEATATKDAAAAVKVASKSPVIPETAITKPD